MLAQLEPIFNYDHVYVGGGNARHLREVPTNTSVFENVHGMTGGIRLWQNPAGR